MDFLSPTSGFIGLGEALAKKAADVFRYDFGQPTPKAQPINPTGFSFDFGGAAQKLLAPFQRVTDPKAAAGTSIINSLGDAASSIIRAAGNKASDILTNANTKKDTPAVQATTITESQAGGASSASIAEILKFFSTTSQTSSLPSAINSNQQAQQIALDAAGATRNSLFLFGGAALLLTFIALSGKGSK